MAMEEAASYLADALGEEVLAEIVEAGLDITVPGAGTLVKAARYAYKAYS